MKTIKLTGFIPFILVFLLSGLNVYGQEREKRIKLYSNFGWSTTEKTTSDTINMTTTLETNKDVQMGYFTPSIAFVTANGNFHELEFSRLKINSSSDKTSITYDNLGHTQTISGQKTTNILIALRYEYNFMFFKKKEEAKLRTYLGLAINPYFENSNTLPFLSNYFPTSETSLGTMLSIIPRINYNLGEKWFIDFNIPINISNIDITSTNKDNPAFLANQRTETSIDLTILPNTFLIRFGIGVKI